MNPSTQTKAPTEAPQVTRDNARDFAEEVSAQQIMHMAAQAKGRLCQSHMGGHFPDLSIFDDMNRKERARVSYFFSNKFNVNCLCKSADERHDCATKGARPCMQHLACN